MPHLRMVVRSPAVLAITAIQVAVFLARTVDSAVADQLSLPGDPEGLSERPWSPLTVVFVHENTAHLSW